MTHRIPALFLGHGSPMNAIEDNPWRRSWQALGADLARPRAILAISAHWETEEAAVSAAARLETIHDFAGFPLHCSTYAIRRRATRPWRRRWPTCWRRNGCA